MEYMLISFNFLFLYWFTHDKKGEPTLKFFISIVPLIFFSIAYPMVILYMDIFICVCFYFRRKLNYLKKYYICGQEYELIVLEMKIDDLYYYYFGNVFGKHVLKYNNKPSMKYEEMKTCKNKKIVNKIHKIFQKVVLKHDFGKDDFEGIDGIDGKVGVKVYTNNIYNNFNIRLMTW